MLQMAIMRYASQRRGKKKNKRPAFQSGQTIREVSRIMGKSSHDITPITKEHRIQLAQNYAAVNGEQDDIVQCEQDRIIPNVKAYKLFDEGKSSLEVAAELNLPGPPVQQFYVE
jgi:hypothetical protein